MSAKKLRVSIVTTEIVPYSKVGGLADVMGALPGALEEAGCEITIFTPLYAEIDRNLFGIEPESALGNLSVQVGKKQRRFKIHSATMPGTDVRVFFIENRHFYGREGIYTDPATSEGFRDEDERTVFFNRAVISAIKVLGIVPDIIHCNDFHSGLIPAYKELEESDDKHFADAGTVFSIHNLAYQGIFKRDFMKLAGFDASLYEPMGPFEYWGRVNLMKIGIAFSNVVSTVSRTYAEEISSTEEFGMGLEGILKARGKDLVGILNGIDQDVWNPETDDLLPAAFSAGDLSGKAVSKGTLLEEFGLPAKPDAPVFGLVSRLVDQKGFDILAEAMPVIMKGNVRFVILGTGQKKFHELYTKLAKKYKGKLGIRLEFNNRLAHLVEAGSDFFLMPSKYEPCGLNQMYSLRYGTIPVVRETGGLKDTITTVTKTGSRGNGFTFKTYSAAQLAKVIKKAAVFYADADALRAVRERIMREDHSWLKSAREYIKLYKQARKRAGLRLTRR